jgi:DNA helicase HerA-like ATPase
MPAGKNQAEDPAAFVPFQVPVSDLTPEDFALLYGTNLVREPAGMLLFELYEKVTRLGYVVRGGGQRPKTSFGLEDLLKCLDDDEIRDPDRGFNRETIRAVSQRLRTWLSDPLFQSNTGTPISELIRAGQLSILCLNRLSEDMRSVITGVLVRKIKQERTRSSQIERRTAFDATPVQQDSHMPRVILAIDEAQMILPSSGGGPARQAIDSYILEGRNFGLSVWLATQRPKGAISSKAMSQLDTLIIHRLSSVDDLQTIG